MLSRLRCTPKGAQNAREVYNFSEEEKKRKRVRRRIVREKVDKRVMCFVLEIVVS